MISSAMTSAVATMSGFFMPCPPCSSQSVFYFGSIDRSLLPQLRAEQSEVFHRHRFGANQIMRLHIGSRFAFGHIVEPSQCYVRLETPPFGFQAASLQRSLDLVLQVVELRVALPPHPQRRAASTLGEGSDAGQGQREPACPKPRQGD